MNNGFNPAKEKSVEISNLANFLKWSLHQPWMVLHELAHSYHHQVLGWDDPEVLKTLTSRLVKEGYQVKSVDNGKEASNAFVTAYYEQPFAVILLDVDLPDINGMEVLKTIRQEEEIRGIDYSDGVKIIMQTGLKEPWMEAFNQGCDDYIIKPYSFEDLLKKIKEKTGEISSDG